MRKSNPTIAQQVAEAASAFQQESTGHAAKSVNVVLGEGTLVVTLHGALTPAEKVLAQTLAGAAQVQEFHRQLFADSCGALRQEIEKITGVEVCEASAEIQTRTGSVVQVFTVQNGCTQYNTIICTHPVEQARRRLPVTARSKDGSVAPGVLWRPTPPTTWSPGFGGRTIWRHGTGRSASWLCRRQRFY